MKKQITFATRAQATIFQHEIKGQISDGMWENTPGTDWETWCKAEVAVGQNIGRTFFARKTGFALERLVEVIGDRMIEMARLAIAFPQMSIDEIYPLTYCTTDIDVLRGWATKSEFYQQIIDDLAAAGGADAVRARMDAVPYGVKELRADLKAIKTTMKTRWQPLLCERCDREVDADKAVWLELNCMTGRYSDPKKGTLPSNVSQGVFPFGADCAKQILAEEKALQQIDDGILDMEHQVHEWADRATLGACTAQSAKIHETTWNHEEQ